MRKKLWEDFSKNSNKMKTIIHWEWLKEHPEKDKYEFFRDFFDMNWNQIMLKSPTNDCFACAEALDFENGKLILNCKKCPIDWAKGSDISDLIISYKKRAMTCVYEPSPFIKWSHSKTKQEKEQYSQEIIDLTNETWKE